MRKSLLVLIIIFVSFSFLAADVYVKSTSHTSAFEVMGQKNPEKTETTEQWIGDGQFARISGNQSMIIDLSKKMMYIIYNDSQTYVETSLPVDMSKILPPQAAQMLSMFKMTAKVTPTENSKVVGKWKTKEYNAVLNLTGMMPMTMNMKIWASKDVPMDWKKYKDTMLPEIMKASSSSMPFGDEIINEFKKIEGFQVASEMTMNIMGADMKVTSNVIEMVEKKAPAGIYSVPAGFSKVEKMKAKKGM